MPAPRRLRHLARTAQAQFTRAQRIPRRLRREQHRIEQRLRPHEGPALSVVMPVYNVETWLAAALDSVLSQSLRDLEVIVVDDGSTDGSAAIVAAYAARDPRITVVTKVNAGLGAARNTGTEHARGEFLAFMDSDDLILPGAYEEMVGRLRASGSDFITASFLRGEENTAQRPGWQRRVMHDRVAQRVADDPWLLLDITACNKVFRRRFWDRQALRFEEGLRYEDQLPITTAYLRANAIDVLRRPVYLWRMRDDGTSITQQKATLPDLRDRLLSQRRCEAVLSTARAHVRDVWHLKILDFDLPPYLVAALSTDDEYSELLHERLVEIRRTTPDEVWARIAFPNRARAWVLANGHVDVARQLHGWFERETDGLQVRMVDGVVEYAPPFEISDTELPARHRRAHPVDVAPVARLVETAWEGDTLVLRGSAFLRPLPLDPADHELQVRLVEQSGATHPVPVSRYGDPALDVLSRRAHADLSDSGFEARIDAAALAAAVPPGAQALRLEIVQRQGQYERVSGFTHVHHLGRGGLREPHACGDRMVRLVGTAETGIQLLVRDTFAWTTACTTLDDGRLALTLHSSPLDPVVSACLEPIPTTGAQTVPARPDDTGTPGSVTVLVTAPTEGESRLLVDHRSGARSEVLWGQDPSVVGEPEAAYARRGPGYAVLLGPARPAVSVTGVVVGEQSLELRGTSLGAQGHRLALVSGRGRGLASDPLPTGEFSISVPVLGNPWNHGAMPLPEDAYDVVLLAPEGASPSASPDDAAGLVMVSSTLRSRLPLTRLTPGQHLSVAAPDWTLTVRSEALDPAESSPRAQTDLRAQVYAAARQQPRRPVVLLESFGGKSTGDSPAAIAEELTREHPELDLVWSILDGSVHVPQGARGVHRFSTEWYDLLGSAAYVVNNNNFPHFFTKAPDQIYLQTWHGTPLKKIANDIVDRRLFSLTYLSTMAREAAAWDYLVSPSPYCTEILPRAFGYDGPVLEHGYPRNDALVNDVDGVRRARVRTALGIDDDQRVLLYAPTWRDSAKSGGSYTKVLHLDPAVIVHQVPDTVVLVRGHSNTALAGSVGDASGKVIDVTMHPDVNDLFLASDALITDYSSVMFDYAVLDRPIMFLVPDLANYRDRIRGFYIDFESMAPGPLLADQGALLEHLHAGKSADAAHEEARARFRERFAPFDDGAAASRVTRAVFSVTDPTADPAPDVMGER